MRLTSRATIAIPFIILLAGGIIPLLRDAGSDQRDDTTATDQRVYAGRTAEEWETLAARAIDLGDYSRALSFAKSAERAEDGEQFAGLIKRVRSLRWRDREIARAQERFFRGEVVVSAVGGADEVVASAVDGTATAAAPHRETVALPGESLWSMAALIVATERGLHVQDLPGDDAAIYTMWDTLTQLNGLRELEVGERVLVPIPPDEVEQLRELALALAAERRFAEADSAAAEAVMRGEPSELLLALERERQTWEDELVTEAGSAIEQALTISRTTAHPELMLVLGEARRDLDQAEAITEGDQYVQRRARVEAMIAEAERYRFRDDGAVHVRKPAGVSYTEVAREAVEWLLERDLERSGAAYPHSADKTEDELAWARFLSDACELARSEGADLIELLGADDADSELLLPNPALYFASHH